MNIVNFWSLPVYRQSYKNWLIENQSDVAKLSGPGFRKSLARADAKGICDFYRVEYRDPSN